MVSGCLTMAPKPPPGFHRAAPPPPEGFSRTPEERDPWAVEQSAAANIGFGLRRAATRAGYGLRDLVAEGEAKNPASAPFVNWVKEKAALTDEDRAYLESMEEVDNPYATTGEIMGEAAMIAAPGGAMARAARLPAAVGDITAAVAHGYSKLPKAGQTREENALWEGLFATGGAAAGRALSGAIKPSDDAAKLLAEGYYLTPGMTNSVVNRFEQISKYFPVFARTANKAMERSLSEMSDTALKRVAPSGYGTTITKSGFDGIRQLDDAFNSAYRGAWSQVDNVSDAAKARLVSLTKRLDDLPPDQASRAGKLLNEAWDAANKGSGRALNAIEKKVDRIARTAARTDAPELAEVLMDIKRTIRKGLPASARKELSQIDRQFAHFTGVRNAVKAADLEEGVFDAGQYLRGIKAADRSKGKRAFTAGRAAGQDEARRLNRVMKETERLRYLDPWRRLMANTPLIFPGAQTAGEFAIGNTAVQRAVKANPYAQALRAMGLRGAPIAGAIEE